jgi:hypothetical protein
MFVPSLSWQHNRLYIDMVYIQMAAKRFFFRTTVSMQVEVPYECDEAFSSTARALLGTLCANISRVVATTPPLAIDSHWS